MAKVKKTNEENFNDLLAENKKVLEKIEEYETKLKKYSMQMHRLNDEKLQLLKANEVMKAKLRSQNISHQLNGNSATNLFEGKLIKMLNFIVDIINICFSYLSQVTISKWKMKKVNYLIIRIWMN